ncbi:PucR family transcriptional regulator [Psychrobacillus antarcticus]|uniref:PucR family transcriptional regulator n=1 Tax=Psychrobacillus antarcticus TaxID=2879115 RepID=UPI00240845E4|nr:PucR family transcriptional regulator [Psychrobacillus antarcticus]
MLTVQDLLEIRAIDGLKIIAGEKGINNKISIVNILENPDAFDWLSPNELLLSTGYIFKDNVELQNKIIQELSEINCAGLVIKMKRYFDKLPQNMIDEANKCGLPLLELPLGYTLSNVISIINEKASGRYDLLNRQALDMHNLFFKITLEGGGITRISSMLSGTISNPIIIVDKDWKLLNYSEHMDNKILIKDSLDVVSNKPIFNKKFTDTIPDNLSDMKKSIKRIYDLDGKNIICRIMPIAVSRDIYGYIIIWQTVNELKEFDYGILQQATTIIALERIKAKEIEEVKLKIRHDFFDDLLSGKITSPETLQTLCDLHGLNPNYMYYCTVINIEVKEVEKFEDMISGKFKMDNIAQKCVQLIYELSYKTKGEVTCFHRNNRVIVLVGQSKDRPPITVTEAKQYATDLHEELVKKIKKTFLIGIGQQYKDINLLYKSFSEANEMIRLMQQLNEKNDISHFEDYSVYHLLDSNVSVPELDDFLQKCLGNVLEHDKMHVTSYIDTLENYFYNNQNVSETSKAMYLHRNTLIYRIEKIKEILNTDLKNAEELLRIQIALKIYRILNKNM